MYIFISQIFQKLFERVKDFREHYSFGKKGLSSKDFETENTTK